MTVRRLIVEVELDGLNVREFCHQHGISTWFFYDLRRRFAREGEGALEPKSRAPKRVWNKTAVDLEDVIVAKRKALKEGGLDHGADEVAAALTEAGVTVPSPSTIYRILKARGFIDAQPRKAPKGSGRRFNATRANERWQLDDTSWELTDGAEVRIFNVIDDHSRLLIASRAMTTCTGTASFEALAEAATTLGWPQRFQSDNAKAFRDVLAEALRCLGVGPSHSRPYHPQTNGKVERFHQTNKKWLAAQPRADTLAELQHQLDIYRHHYNHHRQHRSLQRRTPADVWTLAPKTGPADRPLRPPSTLHRTRVANGTIRVPRYAISVGATHNHTTALTIITGHDCHVFIDGQLIRQLTIDPTRRVQPLHPRPGRPKELP
jgi:transposase InsO family protein